MLTMYTFGEASRTNVGAGEDEASWPEFSTAPLAYDHMGWHDTTSNKPLVRRSSLERSCGGCR
jgi:hypothetical protein